MPPEWKIIFDETDRIEDSVRVFELARLKGVEVAYLESNPTGISLAYGILTSLGKRFDYLPRTGPKADLAARTWLEAERVEELVLYGADAMEGASSMVSNLTIRVWIVTRSQAAATAMGEECGSPPVELKHLFEALKSKKRKRAPKPGKKSAANGPFPRIPYNDFLTFVPACRSMHFNDKGLPRILECFETERQLADEALHIPDQPNSETRVQFPGELSIKAHVQRRMAEASSLREAVCRLRAIQISLFARWVFLKVDLLPLLAVLKLDNRYGNAGEIAVRGRERSDAKPGFLATLANCSNLSARQVAKLERSQVADDGSTIDALSEEIQIPEDLQAFARAYLLQEDSAGLNSQYLFHSPRGGQLQISSLGEYRKDMLRLEEPASFNRSSKGDVFFGDPFPTQIRIMRMPAYRRDSDLFTCIAG